MRKIYFFGYLCIASILSPGIVPAQNRTASPIHRCATDENMARLMKEDLGYAQRLAQTDNEARIAAMQSSNRSAMVQVTIPVVFHVIYNPAVPAQNIADSYIFAQLAALNKDYAKLNPDTTSIPTAFKPLAAVTDIQFCLAQRDPNGNPTTGITRTSTTVANWNTNDAVKHTSSGGHDIWDRTKYLNIWICNLDYNVAIGYAQFPNGPAATDGVVVHYGTVGSPTVVNPFFWPGGSNYKWGRTAVHEVGHWLNLRHTFETTTGSCQGTTNAGNINTNCLTGGDKVCDTPPLITPTFGCPVSPTQNGCIEITPFPSPYTSDQYDMWMNYMDYTDDDCMYMFTLGQKTRIQSLFNSGGARFSLTTSNGCVPTGVNEIESLHAFSAYPNPSGGDVTVVLNFTQNEKFEVAVVNAIGQVIYKLSEESDGGIYTLPLANQPKGIYFVKVITSQGTSSQKITLM